MSAPRDTCASSSVHNLCHPCTLCLPPRPRPPAAPPTQHESVALLDGLGHLLQGGQLQVERLHTHTALGDAAGDGLGGRKGDKVGGVRGVLAMREEHGMDAERWCRPHRPW